MNESAEPAFPVPNCAEYQAVGMTLRDYFAAKAMQGLIITDLQWEPEAGSKNAYIWADAMLKSRTEPKL